MGTGNITNVVPLNTCSPMHPQSIRAPQNTPSYTHRRQYVPKYQVTRVQRKPYKKKYPYLMTYTFVQERNKVINR